MVKFGGGGVVIKSVILFELGSFVEIKLFLDFEVVVIFCFGEVIICENVEDDYYIVFIFIIICE